MNFQSEFLILPDQIDSLLTVETMRGFTENNLNSYCFTKRENCKRFCFLYDVSTFVSRLQHQSVSALCNFFGQGRRRCFIQAKVWTMSLLKVM